MIDNLTQKALLSQLTNLITKLTYIMNETKPDKIKMLEEIHGQMRLKRITQQDISDALNISRSTINRQLNAREGASYDYLFKILDFVRRSDALEAKVIVEYYQDSQFIAHRIERSNELADREHGFENAETLVADRDILFSNNRMIKQGTHYKRATQKFGGELGGNS